jgi:hypothetical protein
LTDVLDVIQQRVKEAEEIEKQREPAKSYHSASYIAPTASEQSSPVPNGKAAEKRVSDGFGSPVWSWDLK